MRVALGGVSARGQRGVIRATPRVARGDSIPAPVGGWDSLSPLAGMDPRRAVALDNLFPQPGYLEIRKGHRLHASVATGSTPVESVMAYHALNTTNDKLFAAAGTAIYDVTAGGAGSSVVSGLANARWQHLNFSTTGGNFLVIANGADGVRTWDGSAWATSAITGITAADVIGLCAFSERIWMIRKGQISPAYLPLDSIAGAAVVFDLGGVFAKGGELTTAIAWSRDGGAGPDDYIAFITSRGEVAIYSGDPSSSMALAGVYEMGAPLGRRSAGKYGADVGVICVDGVLPLSRAINTDRSAIADASITAIIQPTMSAAARAYEANFGWQMVSYPRGTRAILNVPVGSGANQEQYVMNTVSGAWCRFLGEPANCWEVFRDRLFYGGNGGNVVEADVQGFDYDGNITFNMETAFNYFKRRGNQKQFGMCRPLLLTDGQAAVNFALNLDFERNGVLHQLASPGGETSKWGSMTWGVDPWSDASKLLSGWIATEGLGFAASIRLQGELAVPSGGSASSTATFQVNGFDLTMTDGAFF